jgi:hypothetical protein
MTAAVNSEDGLGAPRTGLRRASVATGQRARLKVSDGAIPEFPAAAAGAYIPAQRRVIEARLAEALKGPYSGHEHGSQTRSLFISLKTSIHTRQGSRDE